ncbi:MAG: hypothetical protein M3O50_20265 [Myxococcota bacterium]|nr:hypothetical protein [Myxococcota bacterium]
MSKRRSRPPNARDNAGKSRRADSERAAPAAVVTAYPAATEEAATSGLRDSMRDELAALEAGWDELLS